MTVSPVPLRHPCVYQTTLTIADSYRKESLQTYFAGSSLAGVSRPSTRCQTRVLLPCSSIFAHVSPHFCASASGCAGSLTLLRYAWCLAHGRGLRCRALLCAWARVLVPDSESCRWFFCTLFGPRPDHAPHQTQTQRYHLRGSTAPAQSSPCSSLHLPFTAHCLMAPAHSCFASQHNNPRPINMGEILLSVQFSTHHAFARTEKGVGLPGHCVALCRWCGATEPFCVARWNPWLPQIWILSSFLQR